MNITVETDSATEPISLTEAKLHLRIEPDTTDDDTLISALITAARQICEGYQGRSYVTKALKLTLDEFPEGDDYDIELPYPPTISITSVKYVDSDGVQQTAGVSTYTLDATSTPARLSPAYGTSWPSARSQNSAVEIKYSAGYGAAAAVPERIKAAIKLVLGDLYENRESGVVGTIANINPAVAVEAILAPDRVFLVEKNGA